jgi:hypothetical protein
MRWLRVASKLATAAAMAGMNIMAMMTTAMVALARRLMLHPIFASSLVDRSGGYVVVVCD